MTPFKIPTLTDNFKEEHKNLQSELLKHYGVFFAFSAKQFEESKAEGVKYYSLGAGLLCPQDNASAFHASMKELQDAYVKTRIEKEGYREIIKYELYNHECQITQNDEDARDVLQSYGFTDEQFREVFSIFMKECRENDSF